MALSMYQAAVPVYQLGLKGMAKILEKGAAFAEEHDIEETELTSARLAPDMFPFTRQVQIATDHAKGSVTRLAGREVPSWPDTETTFAELQARVAKTAELVSSVSAAELDGTEEKPIQLKVGANMMDFTGQNYLIGFALPNFYFHLTTAYNILRMKGVPLGKGNFFGR